MSDEGRYSRLKAIREYGYDVDWEQLTSKTVTIAGVGGVGSIAAELLARCGIGALHLIDLDKVELVNLNRLVFTDEHIGLTKVEAMKQVLAKVNPEVKVETYYSDLCAFDFEDQLHELLRTSDLSLMCLDNVPARQYFNVKCVRMNAPYMDSGLFRSGLGGYVHLVKPRKTACYQCTGSVQATTTDDVVGPPCSASLPTTVNVIASFQVQQALKYLLSFGRIADYVSYNALSDGTHECQLKIDKDCYVCGSISSEEADDE